MSLFEELQSALQILVAPKLEAILVRLDGVDKRLDITDKRMDRLEQKFDKLEERFQHLEERFGRLDERFERRYDEAILQQQRFRDDLMNEIRTAINFQALAVRVDQIEKTALPQGS